MRLHVLLAGALLCGCGGHVEPDAAAGPDSGSTLVAASDAASDAEGSSETSDAPDDVGREVPAVPPFPPCEAYVVKEGATKIADGVRGVLANGDILFSAGTYDPSTGLFAAAAPIHTLGSFAGLLPDGRVLLVGGSHGAMSSRGSDPEATRWDPETRALIKTSPMHHGRNWVSAAGLEDGRLLVLGGEEGGWDKYSYGPLAPPEIYDPVRDVWTDTASRTLVSRNYAALARLPDGRILVIGGLSRPIASVPFTDPGAAPTNAVEIYDPATDSFRLTTPMHDPRRTPIATVAPDGSVLVFGGTRAERFDPATETWTVTAPAWLGGETLVAQFWSSAFMTTWLPCGGVLLASGAASKALWIYLPGKDRWIRRSYSGGNAAQVFPTDAGAIVVTSDVGGVHFTRFEP